MKKRNLFFLLFIGLSLAIPLCVSSQNQAEVLAASSLTAVHKGDVIEVKDKTLISSTGESKVVSGKIITPSGATYEGDSFSASEFGNYQVVYKAYFGYEKVEKVLSYSCQRRAVDFFSSDASTEISYGEYSHNTSTTSHQGVILDMKAGSTVTFDTLIDVSRLTADTVLFDYIVDPATIGKDDFSDFTLTLYDSEDSSIYVKMYFFNPGTNVCYDSGTHLRVGYEGSFMAGYEAPYLHTANWGFPMLTSFHAYPSQDPTHNGQVWFDYESQTTYASPKFTDPFASGEYKSLVNCFKNVKWYKSSVWGGFPSGKVKLTITPGDFSSTSGKMVVKTVAGYDFSVTNDMEDTTAPAITIDYQNQDGTYLPKAMVNHPYAVFSATALDDFDGTVPVTTSVQYYDDSGDLFDVSVKEGYFVPHKEGKYIITYSASDHMGNTNEEKLYIFTSNVSPISLSLAKKDIDTTVFSSVALPRIKDLTCTGGTGTISYTRTLYDPSYHKITLEDNEFTPTQIGKYTLIFTATDYLGNKASLSVTLTSKGLDKPALVNEPELPPALISGYTYTLNRYQAYETLNDTIIDLSDKVRLYVDGTFVDSSFTADISKATLKDGKYYSTLTYSVTGDSSSETVSKSIEIEVVDVNNTKDKEKYFVGSLDNSTYYKTVSGSNTIGGVELKCKSGEDGHSTFARVLDSSYLTMAFAINDNCSSYSYLHVKLIDVNDRDNTVTFTFNPNDEDTYLNFPGYSSDFAISTGAFSIRYVDASHTVFDTQNNELSEIKYNDNGDAFTGFPDGCYVDIALEHGSYSMGNAGIVVTTLGNQPFTDSTGIKSVDEIAPTIRFDEDVVSEQQVGDDFIYPHVTCYDVLSEIRSLTAKVYYNNDDTCVLVINEDMSNTFTITKYGTYDVEYIAKDTKGESVTYYAHVSVLDNNPPEISISNDTVSNQTFGLGNVISLPTYKVVDDLGEYNLDIILVCPNGERRCLLHDNSGTVTYYLDDSSRFNANFINNKSSFRADMTGKYTLSYLAYDGTYNRTVKNLSFTVK